jgi:hypothetical protein
MPLSENKTVDAAALLRSLMYVQEAILNTLERKGLATKAEIMEEVKRLHLQQMNSSVKQ